MSEQHTDQRLYVDDEGDLCGESTGVLVACPTYPLNDETLVSLEQARGNARRLVAAWNACAGIPTEELEAGIMGRAFDLLNAFLDHEVDYMTRNNLGDPDTQQRIRGARDLFTHLGRQS